MISFSVFHNDEDDMIKVSIRVTSLINGETLSLVTYFFPGNVAKALAESILKHIQKKGELS